MPTRTATPADLDAIAGIYAHYVRTSVATFELEPPDHDEWRRRFDAIVGAAVEDSVYVSPSAVGSGCGTELLRDLLTACAVAGIREVVAVIADTGDPGSLSLHRRHGFTDAGRLRRVGFKHDRFVDTLLLQRSLA